VLVLGGSDHHLHAAAHATTGVIGRDGIIAGSKIEPLASIEKRHSMSDTSQGLDDEAVDTARIEPMGEVRE
jgi:hypothetical protein